MNNELTNGAIQQFLLPLKPSFWGVFSINHLISLIPKAQKAKTFSIIINLSHSSKRGSHFVTILCKNNQSLYYLDSLALPPQLHPPIWEFIQQCQRKSLIQLRTPIQHAMSSACGYFCIFFVLYFSNSPLPQTSINFLPSPCSNNDYICKNLIHHLIKKH